MRYIFSLEKLHFNQIELHDLFIFFRNSHLSIIFVLNEY
jgi:hypothetical protein